MKDKIDQAIKSGDLFFLGNKLPEDFYSAVLEWKHLAEETQDPKSFYNLAYCYRYGEGIERDIDESVRLYRAALDGGIEKAAGKLYDCYGTDPLNNIINLFDPESSIEYAEKYKQSAVLFYGTLNKLIDKGYTQYKSKLKSAKSIIDILELHISFLKGTSEFKICAEELNKQGYTWVPELVKLMGCEVLHVWTYTEAQKTHSYIKDGNTTYANGRKYHTLKTASYIVNKTDHKCHIYTPNQVEILPGQSFLFSEDNSNQEASIKRDFSSSRKTMQIPFIDLSEINRDLGIKTAINVIAPALPVKYEVKEKSLAMRPGNIISFLGAVAFVGMCIYFAMH